MQLCGGLGEIQNFRHSHEIPQVTQFHIVTGSLAISISLATGQWPQSGLAAQAFLLDLEDPTRVIGRLREPLLSPNEAEREGYVPNVVYTCGALLHGRELIIPYAMSDSATSFATVSLDHLLAAME